MASTKKQAIVSLFVIALICAVSLRVAVALNRPAKLVGLKTPIQFDDFAFAVQGVRTAKTLGSGAALTTADGQFMIVTLMITNRAKRVSYLWRNTTALLVDDRGQERRVSSAGQAALESEPGQADPCAGPIPAGSACTKELVFDVPTDVRSPRFHISGGGPIGDALEAVFFGRKAIQLP